MVILYGIKKLLFSKDIPLCLWWNIRFYALLLISFELFKLITNKEYISMIGAYMIAFSGFIQWNFEYSNVIIFGEIIVLLVHKLFGQKKLNYQIITSVLISIFIVLYYMCGISVAISFEFAFVPIIIWIFIKNIENIKKNRTSVLLLIASVISFACTLILCGILKLLNWLLPFFC